MASTPSSTLLSPLYESNTFCNFTSLQKLSFPLNNKLLHSKSVTLTTTHVSLQEQSDISNPTNPRKTASSSKSSYIWVNPQSPKASQLRQKSYDSRYASLVKMAESLDSCNPVEEDMFNVLAALGDKVVEQDAVVILNNMSNAETALLVLKYFQQRLKLSKEVIIYNVTLKVLRKSKDLDRAEKLFDEMLQRGVKPDNVTFSTIISCARQCNLPEKAIEWFEKLPSFGCEPDDVTYSVMIDSYGKAGNVDMALNLYDRARTEKWRIDAVTFATLIRIYGAAGNFDGCLNVYEEMKALGVRPNMAVYNSLLDAMGRAKRPWQAKNIYADMISNGFQPSWGTYASLIRAYGRARYSEDALKIYREVKEKGLELSVVLYNTLLAMCADVGLTDEAVNIFEEMKASGTCQPDSWTYSSLITINSCSGKVSEAEATLNEMMEAGFDPNIFVLTSLIQCYGKAGRTDDVVRTFDRLSDLGLSPDERFTGCLLNVLTQTPKEDLHKLTVCLEKANPKLGYVVKLLVDEEAVEEGIFKKHAAEILDCVTTDVQKAYCNCLIDICVNLNQLERACELLDIGLTLNIYADIQSRTATQWSLQLKSLSLGAALTALHIWMNDLNKALENGEEFPSLLGINTGHGKHKYSEKGLAGVFESHLKELNAPFHEAPDKAGWFLTTKVAAISWLESRRAQEVVAA
nr:PREDICTED: pentatricopeptide repeat-containing protein At4g16390, chloroplastic [Nicotiana tabacum]